MAGKHDTIADALIEDILSGRYRVDERLPSERDLAARFQMNRGAVREAMKRLEQLGLATIAPGGARVNALEQASLDVVGYLLARGAEPDARLVDQILTVVHGLISIAADAVVHCASDADIDRLRRHVLTLIQGALSIEAHQQARFELMRDIMQTSGNLICQLIARTLLEQFAPVMEPVIPQAAQSLDRAAYADYARQLDAGLAARDVPAVRAALEAFSTLNRKTVMQAFSATPDATTATPDATSFDSIVSNTIAKVAHS